MRPKAISLVMAVGMALSGLAHAQSTDRRIGGLQARLPGWRHAMAELIRRGQDVSYPLVTYTVLERFTDYAAEDLRTHVPDYWGFATVNGSDSAMEILQGQGRTPRTAVRLVNRSPLLPHRYGALEYTRTLTLESGTPYTFSVWAKTTSPGRTSLVAGRDGQFRAQIPDTGGRWKRVDLTFTPGDTDTAFQPRIITEQESTGVLLDDFWFCEGNAAERKKNLLVNGSLELSWPRRRAVLAVADMEEMAARLDRELAAANDGNPLPTTFRWNGDRRPMVDGPSFIAPTGPAGDRPLFFLGYGHSDQARQDLPHYPAYGVNLIQQKIGPASIYPAEGKRDLTPVDALKKTLDDAARHGVAIDLLLSPHDFPGWMFEKHPDLRRQRAGFLPFSIHHPAAMPLLRQYVKDVVEPIKDHPALFSICLSNEPANLETPGEHAAAVWRQWLAKHHGGIATLNARWKGNYRTFADVPCPDPLDPTQWTSPLWVDWVRFSQESLAEFHRQLAAAVHEVAPGVPVHAKPTTPSHWRASHVRAGVDAHLFSTFSQIHGNDSHTYWGFAGQAPEAGPPERGTRQFAQGWIENALAFDLLRSTKDAPIFNGENHLIADREPRWVSPQHIRAALWQGALHGQSATTLWIWERTFDRRSDFAGSILERPLCAEAVGRVCHDLNRVANEMTALQRKPADVQILQSFTSSGWDGAAAQDALVKTYAALSFMGLKIGFITEHQLEAGTLPTAQVVIAPAVHHLSAAAARTLGEFTGTTLLIGGQGVLSRDEYDQPLKALPGARRVDFGFDKMSWPALWETLLPILEPVRPAVCVAGAQGDPIADVQWLQSGNVLNLYNPRPWPVRFRLTGGDDRTVTDLLTGASGAASMVTELKPLEVRLYRLD